MESLIPFPLDDTQRIYPNVPQTQLPDDLEGLREGRVAAYPAPALPRDAAGRKVAEVLLGELNKHAITPAMAQGKVGRVDGRLSGVDDAHV
ncbi:hypothetical protein ColLi_07097 [Colletotrichum liriopes]|uniref:Uncharacterized protein n=1 Tax=Colletotrichum liriopes TaxID=708192 RepID=A0AA37GP42_9PEZI|nr:hypothetical protein ColLi_07097 [Colletotrichum liriopes]